MFSEAVDSRDKISDTILPEVLDKARTKRHVSKLDLDDDSNKRWLMKLLKCCKIREVTRPEGCTSESRMDKSSRCESR